MTICRQCARDLPIAAFAETCPNCCRDCVRENYSKYKEKALFKSNYVVCPICNTKVAHFRVHHRRYHSDKKFPLDTDTIFTLGMERQVKELLALQRISDSIWDWDRKSNRIYFVLAGEAGRPIKIGSSQNLAARLSDLQTAIPDQLQVLLTYDATENEEERLHIKFSDYWISGEWFKSSPVLLSFIHHKLLTTEPVPTNPRNQKIRTLKERKCHVQRYASLKEHQQIARTLGIRTSIEWMKKHDEGVMPFNISRQPNVLPEWKGWPHFLRMGMTPKQLTVLHLLSNNQEHQVSDLINKSNTSLPTNIIYTHLKYLREKGCVAKNKETRGYHITNEGLDIIKELCPQSSIY